MSCSETHSQSEWQRLVLEHTQLQEHHQEVLRNTAQLEEEVQRLQTETESMHQTQTSKGMESLESVQSPSLILTEKLRTTGDSACSVVNN